MTRVKRLQSARDDMQEIVDGMTRARAAQFVAAVKKVFATISVFPLGGSKKYAAILGMPGMLMAPTPTVDFLVFYYYTATTDTVEVVRVLPAESDIVARFRRP